MPFATTTVQPLTASSKVTVKFAGLMLLRPGANNSCEIGIHRFNNDHSFQVLLIVKKPQRAPTSLRLTGSLTRKFKIEVTPDPGTGVRAYTPTPGPFVRDDAVSNELDFRWAIDLSTAHANIDFNDGAEPIATLNAGVLYTPTLTPTALVPQLVQRNVRTPLQRFSADLAAAINLPLGTRLELTWEELGEPRTYTLPRPLDPPATTYTVSLMNDPPVFSPVLHDELPHYYRVLHSAGQPIDPGARCRMIFGPGPTTDEIPCMPIVLNP